MDTAGVCLGAVTGNGTCAFDVNIYNLITKGVNHTITAKAIDAQTLEEKTLNTTDKILNCIFTPPTVNSLNITCVPGTSCSGGITASTTGRLSTTGEGGSNWYNPINLTVTASAGTGTISNYYAILYTGTSLTSSSTLADLKAKTPSPSANGFLLRYDGTTHYVWVNPNWISITGGLYEIDNGSIIGTIIPNGARSWRVTYQSGYGSKTLHTGTFVEDSNNLTAINNQ